MKMKWIKELPGRLLSIRQNPEPLIDIRCPYCREWMTVREATTQGACDKCKHR